MCPVLIAQRWGVSQWSQISGRGSFQARPPTQQYPWGVRIHRDCTHRVQAFNSFAYHRKQYKCLCLWPWNFPPLMSEEEGGWKVQRGAGPGVCMEGLTSAPWAVWGEGVGAEGTMASTRRSFMDTESYSPSTMAWKSWQLWEVVHGNNLEYGGQPICQPRSWVLTDCLPSRTFFISTWLSPPRRWTLSSCSTSRLKLWCLQGPGRWCNEWFPSD